ncbi:MAG TPA: class I SAM-dependent methyltransferase [Candidatus Paceibacterota bacterium]|nr:class I SAM-dependent methyltransferase [Candidatus Paceibacterota bacterium]
MLYKLRVLALNNRFLKRVIRKSSKIVLGKDMTNDAFDNASLVRKYASGKSFADIGALWGVHGANTFAAEEAGAIRSVAVDVYPESKEFIEAKKKRGSKVEFIQGDINSAETIKKIGACDVVLCAGVLYHTPDPSHMLMRLRAITKETFILNTASIPEMKGLSNAAVFYPFLNENQRKVWQRGIGMQRAITGPYEPQEGYANWFWGMTPSCLESLLNCAGFDVVEKYIFNFRCVFVCKAAPVKFVPESGEWTTPKDAAAIKFR